MSPASIAGRRLSSVESATDHGCHAQRSLRGLGQALQFRRQQLRDVLRDRGVLHCGDVVAEAFLLTVEADQLRAVQRLEELAH
jgi:hypothetical protein